MLRWLVTAGHPQEQVLLPVPLPPSFSSPSWPPVPPPTRSPSPSHLSPPSGLGPSLSQPRCSSATPLQEARGPLFFPRPTEEGFRMSESK